jgi:hypothetical protein
MALSENAFAALRDAVTLARDRQVHKVKVLRALLIEHGHQEADVDEGLKYWATYVKAKWTLEGIEAL